MSRSAIILPLLLSIATAPALAAGPWDTAKRGHSGSRDITVYRSPTCECCKDWLAHLRKHGFKVTDVSDRDMVVVKTELGLPMQLASCHTAVIGDYVIEGHVPADDIKRLVAEKSTLAGLAVPGMPTGAPGMQVGNKQDPFAVQAFDRAGNIEVYSQYWQY
jgi:hypothetical protein